MILHTTDAGATWTAQTSGTTQPLLDVSAVDANTAWAVGDAGTILYTTDGGTTWSAQTNPASGIIILRGVSAIDANTAWVVGNLGTILYTTNAGTTWNDQTTGTEVLQDVSAVDANTAWAVGSTGTILFTNSGGGPWITQTSGTTNVLVSVSAADASTAWVVGLSFIRFTTDGGTTWSAQTSGTLENINGVSAVDANTAWAVGTGGTILKSSNDAIIIGTTSITGVCEVDLTTGSLAFGTGDPISNGAGVGVGEISEVLTNTLGNLQSSVGVYGTDWTDGGALTIMLGSHTVVDTVGTGVFGDKTPLSTNSLRIPSCPTVCSV